MANKVNDIFFRAKVKDKEKQKEDAKLEAELKHMLLMRRRAAMRKLHQKRYQALDILPPGIITIIVTFWSFLVIL